MADERPGRVGGSETARSASSGVRLPAINTAILLTSSVTVTIAHHALREGKRGVLTRSSR
jgi:cytochrome c oxidase subunit 3